ncbi:hypothetical protein SAMN05660324_2517 [Klenkia brasiliensis]|uniref:Uncharacterized protein n=1 Tax=Klenkia brasiliensis TaxID=333142 RepID=A0A1G7TKI7_9ACTN|nr:hypothetical protein SAMN05660324_2517 [Klenkia brasiliensis]
MKLSFHRLRCVHLAATVSICLLRGQALAEQQPRAQHQSGPRLARVAAHGAGRPPALAAAMSPRTSVRTASSSLMASSSVRCANRGTAWPSGSPTRHSETTAKSGELCRARSGRWPTRRPRPRPARLWRSSMAVPGEPGPGQRSGELVHVGEVPASVAAPGNAAVHDRCPPHRDARDAEHGAGQRLQPPCRCPRPPMRSRACKFTTDHLGDPSWLARCTPLSFADWGSRMAPALDLVVGFALEQPAGGDHHLADFQHQASVLRAHPVINSAMSAIPAAPKKPAPRKSAMKKMMTVPKHPTPATPCSTPPPATFWCPLSSERSGRRRRLRAADPADLERSRAGPLACGSRTHLSRILTRQKP